MRRNNPNEFLWTDAAIALLTNVWLAGGSSGECGRRLGISRSAAIGKLGRLGLLGIDRAKQAISVPKPRPQTPPLKRNKRPLPPPEPYQAPPRPPDPRIGSFGLLELQAGQCRWPSGDRAPFTFCGAPQQFGSSYCAAHELRSLTPKGVASRAASPLRQWRIPI